MKFDTIKHKISSVGILLSIPLGVMNALSGLVAFIWLIILGEWAVIGYGIAGMWILWLSLKVVMVPLGLISFLGMIVYERGNKTQNGRLFNNGILFKTANYFLFFASNAYITIVLSFVGGVVLWFFASQFDVSTLTPTLILSYSVATAPVVHQLGTESDMLVMHLTFFQFAYLISIIAFLFFNIYLTDAIVIICGVMLISFISASTQILECFGSRKNL